MYGSNEAKRGTDFRRSQLASHKRRARGTRVKRFRYTVVSEKPVSIANKKRSLQVARNIIQKNQRDEMIALFVTVGITAIAIVGLFIGLTYVFQYI